MDKIEKIRQEIERRKGYISVTHFAEELLSFLDTLSEEPDKDLEEEIKNYFQGYWPGTETAEQCNTDLHFTPPAILRLARHFAEWQKEKDTRDMYMSDTRHFQKVYELGKKDMKEQMMKEAAVYVAEPETPIGNILIPFIRIDHSVLFRYGIKVGDKVRIIVLPKEG